MNVVSIFSVTIERRFGFTSADYEAKRGAGQPISPFVYRVAGGRILKGPILVTPR